MLLIQKSLLSITILMENRLFDLDGEAVEVTCNLLENEEGLVYLKVLSYSVIESDEEDFEEGEPDEPEDPLI